MKRIVSRYIYTEHVELRNVEQPCKLSYAAKKYSVPHLLEKCSEFMWTDLTVDNACRALEYAVLYEDVNLKVHISLFIV